MDAADLPRGRRCDPPMDAGGLCVTVTQMLAGGKGFNTGQYTIKHALKNHGGGYAAHGDGAGRPQKRYSPVSETMPVERLKSARVSPVSSLRTLPALAWK